MKLSLSNGIFSELKLEENFTAVKNLGFENIEFNMKTVKKENDTSVFRAAKLLETSGLHCLTLHSASLHVNDPVEVHRAVYYGKISLEFAKKLSAPIMTVHSDVSKKLPEQTRNQCLTEIFTELNKFARKLNIKLALENLSYTSTGFGKNVDELEKVLKIIDKGDMGITLDYCHALETRQADNLLEKYGRRICNVHMANKSHRPFVDLNQGLSSFLAKLNKFGYKGPITLELAHKTTIEQIAKSKVLFDRILKEF